MTMLHADSFNAFDSGDMADRYDGVSGPEIITSNPRFPTPTGQQQFRSSSQSDFLTKNHPSSTTVIVNL